MSIRKTLLALTAMAGIAGTAYAADPAPAAPAPEKPAATQEMHGHHGPHGQAGMHGKGGMRCSMHDNMMKGGHHMSQMIMLPRLPRGNEKLQLQMHAEILQKIGEIEAKYAEKLP